MSNNRRWARGKTAILISPSNGRYVIPREEARLQIAFQQAELISPDPLVVKSLWFPLYDDEQSYQNGRYATGFTHAAWNGEEAGPGVVRCKPPADRFSEDYLRLKHLLSLGPVKRGI